MRRYGRQRGVAALEFALVLPAFLAMLGGSIYIGLALFARFTVLNAVNISVRQCVVKQAGFTSPGNFQQCAAQAFSFLAGSNLLTVKGLCAGGLGQVSPGYVPIGQGPLRNSLYLLTLNVKCSTNMGAMMFMTGSGGGPQTWTLSISSGMPFVLNPSNSSP